MDDTMAVDNSATPAVQGTKRTHSGSHRPSASHSSSAGASENSLSSLTLQSPVTPEIRNHIDALKHLDDWLIFELLQSARHYATGSRTSGSTLASRSPSQTRSADPRYSTASSSTLVSQSSQTSSQTSYTTQLGTLLEAYGQLGEPLPTATKTASSVSNSKCATSKGSPTQKPLPPDPPTKADAAKNYVCTFCEETFKSKAYWRTHEEELHEQPRRWTCPDCYRTFHAEKKYRRHHAEGHNCANCALSKQAERMQHPKSRSCADRRLLRVHNKQAYGCGFCAHLLGSWGERCDHVAGHLERGAVKAEWDFSKVVQGLLMQPKLAEAWKALLKKEHGDDPAVWPRMEWDKKDARDLHRSLEQNGAVRDRVAALAQSAYDQGRLAGGAAASSSDLRLGESTSSLKSGASQPHHSDSSTVQPIVLRAPEKTLVVTMPSQPTSEHDMTAPRLPSDQVMNDMDFLHQALDEQLTAGPYLGPAFDFNPDWSLAQSQSDIITFDYPGAYTDFEANRI